MKIDNLKKWETGVSGNPKGRPKGSRNIKTVIQELLGDPNTATKLAVGFPGDTRTPLEAIVYTLVIQAIKGDVRASDVLLKHAIDKDVPQVEGGFFSQTQLNIVVVDGQGNPRSSEDPLIDEATGTFII